MKTVYLGEYADEIFGGYDKRYLDGWAGHLSYGMPVYTTLHDHFKLDTEMPFKKLYWQKMLPYFDPPNKFKLKEAYRNILPDFIINKPKTAPAFSERSYMEMWDRYIKKIFPHFNVTSPKDVRMCLQYIACDNWVEMGLQWRLRKQ